MCCRSQSLSAPVLPAPDNLSDIWSVQRSLGADSLERQVRRQIEGMERNLVGYRVCQTGADARPPSASYHQHKRKFRLVSQTFVNYQSDFNLQDGGRHSCRGFFAERSSGFPGKPRPDIGVHPYRQRTRCHPPDWSRARDPWLWMS